MRPTARFMVGSILQLLLLATPTWAKEKPPLPVPLDPALPILIVLPQPEIGVASLPYGPWSYGYGNQQQGGLLVQYTLHVIQQDNERRIVPLRDKLIGKDFRGRLEADLRKRVLAAEISPAPIISVAGQAWTDEEALAASSASAGRFMMVTGTYGFDEIFKSLNVYVAANVYTVRRKSNGKVVYDTERARLYQAAYVREGRYKGTTINANWWSEIPGEKMARMIETGIDTAGEMFSYDLGAEGQEESRQKVKMTWDGSGRVVKTFPDHAWSRASEEYLVARWLMPESMPPSAP